MCVGRRSTKRPPDTHAAVTAPCLKPVVLSLTTFQQVHLNAQVVLTLGLSDGPVIRLLSSMAHQ
eukprot:7789008-Karenia_brevis.AAC.1